MRASIIAIITSLALLNCMKNDRNAMFSDEEMSLIESLLFTSTSQIPADTTNKYEQTEAVATLGRKFYWDTAFSGMTEVGGVMLDTADHNGDGTYTDLVTIQGMVETTGNTNSNTTVDNISDTAGIRVGMVVEASADIASGTTVTAYTSNSVTLSAAAGASTAGVTLKFGFTKKVSCATCHNPGSGFVDRKGSKNNQTEEVSLANSGFLGIHTPTVINAYFNDLWLWRGAADSGWGLMSRPVEGNPHKFGRYCVMKRICSAYDTDYDNAFGAIDCGSPPYSDSACDCNDTRNNFGKGTESCFTSLSSTVQSQINTVFANFAKAINAYQRKVVSMNSAFDKWVQGDDSYMSDKAVRGLKVFIGKGNCITCHNGPAFSDGKFHNLGIPHTGSFFPSTDNGAEDGLSALLGSTDGQHTVFRGDQSFSDDTSAGSTKLAAYPTSAAGQAEMRGEFKTPGLRSITQTSPYMHTGQLADLWDVVNFYSFGGAGTNFAGTVDPIMIPRNLTNDEMLELVEFLKHLDGETLSTDVTDRPTIP